MQLSTHTIRRVRLPAPIGRQAAARGTIESWLASRDLRRYGLPPGAIVLVRSLRASWAQLAEPTNMLHGDALGSVLAGALRPALAGDTAAGAAGAVWFADEAELLACLGRDLLAGRAASLWWWAALLQGAAAPQAVIARWIGSARAVPRAVERMQDSSPGSRWFDVWDTPSRHALLQQVARHYPVAAAVQRFIETGQGGLPRAVGWPAAAGLGAAPPEDSAASTAVAAATRLHRLCLQLAIDPGCAFDEAYVQRELRREERLAVAARSSEVLAPARGIDRVPIGTSLAPEAAATPSARMHPAAAGLSSRGVETARPSDARPLRQPLAAQRAEATIAQTTSPVAAAIVQTTSTDTVDVPEPAAACAAARPVAGFDTGHGGLFFVLNAALQLGLYGDFTRPLEGGSTGLSPWQFLHAVGAAFGGRRFMRDRLAHWLQPQPPAPLRPGDAGAPWCIERAWLAAFDADTRPLRAVVEGRWLALHHPAGFALSSGPAALADQLAALGLDGRAVQQVQAAPPAHGSLAMQRLLPYLRARLALALGLSDRRRLAGVLLRLPARVDADGERIDVRFVLQQLPLAVRLAGLDRDPGWLPAAGRDLRFHFE